MTSTFSPPPAQRARSVERTSPHRVPLTLPKPVRPKQPPQGVASHQIMPHSSPSPGHISLEAFNHAHGQTQQTLPGGAIMQPLIKIAVVGDIHGQWDSASAAALASLDADIVVFVGDIGNEDVEIVERVAAVSIPPRKAVILGNHDAWYSLTPKGRQRAIRVALASSSTSALRTAEASIEGSQSNIERMLRMLGPTHVGYSALAFPELGTAIVGGRPFSKGGERWDDVAAFYARHFDIHSMEESSHRIVDIALEQDPALALIFVAHSGPSGLGARRHSPCGVDWQLPERDFGDPDLAEALDALAAQGRPPPLVLFGHMHHALKGGGLRDMAAVHPQTGTVYLNAAFVPRTRRSNAIAGCEARIGYHFMVVEMKGGAVHSAKHVWVAPPSDDTKVDGTAPMPAVVVDEEEILKVASAGDGSGSRVLSYYRAHSGEWAQVTVPPLSTILSENQEWRSVACSNTSA